MEAHIRCRGCDMPGPGLTDGWCNRCYEEVTGRPAPMPRWFKTLLYVTVIAAVIGVCWGCGASAPTAPVADPEPPAVETPLWVGTWTTDGPAVRTQQGVEILIQLGLEIAPDKWCHLSMTFASSTPSASAVRGSSETCYPVLGENHVTVTGIMEFTVYPEPGVPPYTVSETYTTRFTAESGWELLLEDSYQIPLLRR